MASIFSAPQGGKAALDTIDTNEGTKKKAVERAQPTPAATPRVTPDDGRPDKSNVERRPDEKLDDFIGRLTVLRDAWDKLHPKD